jgi:hypothetical protein
MRVEAAHLPSPQKSRDTSPPIELYIGGQIAKLVTVLIAAIAEREKGKVTAKTKDLGSDLMVELIKLRFCWPGFDGIAHKFGLEVLREHCAVNLLDVSDGYLTGWINEALKAMTAVARIALN